MILNSERLVVFYLELIITYIVLLISDINTIAITSLEQLSAGKNFEFLMTLLMQVKKAVFLLVFYVVIFSLYNICLQFRSYTF